MTQCLCHNAGRINTGMLLNKVLQFDPTRTLTLRNRFVTDMNRRFKKLMRKITEAIVEQDVFGLKEIPHTLAVEPQPRMFAFERTADKVEGFMTWLQGWEDEYILSKGVRGARIVVRPGTIRGVEQAWTDVYIDTAYQQGIRRARQELRQAGADIPMFEGLIPGGGDQVAVAFNQPIHADRVGLAYTRTFNELKGITNAMDQQISRVLAEGLAEGRNPREIARIINNRVDKIGITRARMLARTEVIRAHHVANIMEYERAGIEGVRIKAEWSTAGFNVCPICTALEGQIFTLEEILPMIPRHPNCRCVAIPVVGIPGK